MFLLSLSIYFAAARPSQASRCFFCGCEGVVAGVMLVGGEAALLQIRSIQFVYKASGIQIKHLHYKMPIIESYLLKEASRLG